MHATAAACRGKTTPGGASSRCVQVIIIQHTYLLPGHFDGIKFNPLGGYARPNSLNEFFFRPVPQVAGWGQVEPRRGIRSAGLIQPLLKTLTVIDSKQAWIKG